MPTYTKNQLVYLSKDKELSLGADVMGWNSLKKQKSKKTQFFFFLFEDK